MIFRSVESTPFLPISKKLTLRPLMRLFGWLAVREILHL